MATDINIPRGWERVTKGRVESGDKCYRLARKGWELANVLPQFMGDKVSEFVFVIRRKPAPAKKAAKLTAGIERTGRDEWACKFHTGKEAVHIFTGTRAEARRIRAAVLAALNGEG